MSNNPIEKFGVDFDDLVIEPPKEQPKPKDEKPKPKPAPDKEQKG